MQPVNCTEIAGMHDQQKTLCNEMEAMHDFPEKYVTNRTLCMIFKNAVQRNGGYA